MSNDEPLTSGASIPGIAAPAGEEALPAQVLVRAVRGDALSISDNTRKIRMLLRVKKTNSNDARNILRTLPCPFLLERFIAPRSRLSLSPRTCTPRS